MRLLLLAFVFCHFNSFTQEDSKPRFTFGMQFGHQAIVSFHGEVLVVSKPNFQIGFDAGLGLAEFSESESSPPQPATYVIHWGPEFLGGFKQLKMVGGIHPSSYFYGGLAYTNLNGLLGLRWTPAGTAEHLLIQLHWSPLVYSSLTSQAPNVRVPFGLKIGAWF